MTLLENDLGDGSRRAVVEASTTTTVTATGEPSVALGGGMARCAVRYDAADLEVLTDREVVFDGTVTAIGEPGEAGEHRFQHDVEVTFEVHEWFVPDGPATVDVIMVAPGVISSNGTVDYGVGSRLLIVAGSRTDSEPLDSPVAGYCGFSRTYDEPTADAWREAFAASG